MTTPNAPESGQQRLLSQAIAERRATPAFDGSPVPDEVLSAILRAGLEAPSGYNLQPWRFVVVRNPEQKRRYSKPLWVRPKLKKPERLLSTAAIQMHREDRNLDEVLAEAAKHGVSEEQKRKVKEAISSVFGKPAGNAMGVAPDWAVWINRHVMIAFTTMMWMAEVLGYDRGFLRGQGEVGAQPPRLHPCGRITRHRQAKRIR
jgi:nitroreductase